MVKSKSPIEIKLTKDGSFTLYVSSMDETYHSIHGAIQEATHVFIKNGVELLEENNLRILEVGFGTGLNALLTLKYAEEFGKRIFYQGLESNPVESELVKKLNYSSQISGVSSLITDKIHQSSWNLEAEISPFFTLLKSKIKVQDFSVTEKFDLINYDAFGPRAQIEMWDKSIFEKLYSALKPGGFLVTYCAMGQFKRDLKACGFQVSSVPGPPGKREMTIAKKIA